MTIATTTSRISYAGSGTSSFAYPYEFQKTSDLGVALQVASTGAITTLTLTTDYTISGTVDPVSGFYLNGGTITTVVAVPTGTNITLYRFTPDLQTLSLSQAGVFPSKQVEAALDNLALAGQRSRELGLRSAHLPDGFTPTFDTTLPPTVNLNPGAALMINLAGNGFDIGPTSGAIAGANAAAVAAAASATAASGSATAAATSATNANTSAGTASTAATTATGAASTATTAATNAGNSATAASGSATSANSANTAAQTAATNAFGYQGNASTSATNAGNSATAAAGSATAAGTSATNAATSATNAGNSATAAATSATNAAKSGGFKNYFSLSNANGNLESGSISPWTTASTTFTSGVPGTLTTGGTGAITIAVNSTTPLSGTYDLLMTKPASNVQGTGFASGTLTIDKEDLAKIMYISCSYQSSSTNMDASGSSTQSLEFWIYDVTASSWIQPVGYRGMNQNSGPGKVVLSFQTPAASTQFKVVVFTNQTSTLAYNVEFDSFSMGPTVIVTGASMSDWQDYTPTFVGMGTVTVVYAKWKQVGDSIAVATKFTTGTVTATTQSMSLPNGFVPNLPALSFAADLTGNTSAPLVALSALVGGGSSTFTFGSQGTGFTSGQPFSSSNLYAFSTDLIPIVGKSSNTQSSADSDQRIIRSTMGLSSNFTTTGSTTTKVAFNQIVVDKNGAVQIANSRYIAQISGSYTHSFTFSGNPGASGTTNVNLYKNGTQLKQGQLYTNGASGGSVTWDDDAVAGDYYEIWCLVPSSTFQFYSGLCFYDVKRMAGPSVVQNTESVSASAYNSVSQSVASATTTTLVYDTKDYDSHAQLTLATGIFTVPVMGTYRITGYTQGNGGTGTGPFFVTANKLSGGTTTTKRLSRTNTMTANQSGGGSTTFRCLAGDQLFIQMQQNTGSVISNEASQQYMNIELIK